MAAASLAIDPFALTRYVSTCGLTIVGGGRDASPLDRCSNVEDAVKKILLLAVLCIAGWGALTRFRGTTVHPLPQQSSSASSSHRDTFVPAVPKSSTPATFTCDGRVYCSQMTSCEEATYFLQHCPGVKMDGDHDGIPCEKQWCAGG